MTYEELDQVWNDLTDLLQGPELCRVANDSVRDEARAIVQHAANDIQKLREAQP